jgi:glyoxylase-like metal-dependent hydrolase (beta-lactamase superfamily II)
MRDVSYTEKRFEGVKTMNRRDLIKLSAGGLAVAALPFNVSAAGLRQLPGAQRFTVGRTTITALSDGYVDLINAQTLVGIDEDGYEAALATAGRGAGARQSDVNAYLVDNGRQKILVDAGGSKSFIQTLGGVPDALRYAGYQPEDITHILMSHLHPDHVSGVLDETNNALYVNAEMIIHEREMNFWVTSDTYAHLPQLAPFFEIARHVATAYDGRIRTYTGTDVGLAGIVAEPMFGHTPGHVGFVIEDSGEHVLVTSDLVLHSVIQLMYPDVSVAFDTDPDAATAVRQRVLGRAAQSQERLIGMHFPFPGLGRIECANDGFRWVAEEWQFL